MQLRNAIVSHTILASAQPVYYAWQIVFHPGYLSACSPVWLLLSLLTYLFIITRITVPFIQNPLWHLPSPSKDSFFLGHRPEMGDFVQPPIRFADLADQIPNEGIIGSWDILHVGIRVFLTSPEACMEVLNTHGYDWVKPSAAKTLISRVLGQGLVNVEGSTHKAMRKSVAPAFSGRHIRDLVPLFWSKGLECAEAMVRDVREAPDAQIEIMERMSRVTLDIIGAAGMGVELNTVNNDENKLAKLYSIITTSNRGSLPLWWLINVFCPPWFLRRLKGTVYARVANASLELRRCIRELLAEKKRTLKESSVQQKDIIATIIRSGDFSDDYLCDQLLTFFAAGHDTTASALTWTTWLLALHPSIQDQLRKECQDHLEDTSPSEINADIFDSMPYLTAVCNETLRLYPTVPITARIATVDTKIGEVCIPKGTEAMISPWVMNRHPQLWGHDAAEYRPERWLEGPLASSGGSKNPYAFMTFLYGPRSCIGQTFARTEMKCLLTALVLRFRFGIPEDGEEVKFGGLVTIKPKGGLKLKVQDLKANV